MGWIGQGITGRRGYWRTHSVLGPAINGIRGHSGTCRFIHLRYLLVGLRGRTGLLARLVATCLARSPLSPRWAGVQRRVWAHSRADHLLSNEWGTQRSVQSGRLHLGRLSSAWNGAKGAINGVKSAPGSTGGAIGGVIDKVQSLSALGRIKVPSIKLPSLGGLGIVQRQRFDHERWRYVHEAHASAQEKWRLAVLPTSPRTTKSVRLGARPSCLWIAH